MKTVIAFTCYLLIGGLLMGGPAGEMIRECPNKKLDMKVLAVAALWPVFFGMAMTVGKLPSRDCQGNLK
ncbi:hypothetical protein [Pseudomonas aeruginosa]|uniref:hypothetical protein n=1 Tax=Pseudomonas aeruginosa TaxID=287 RepID=UPI0032E4169C